MFRTLIVDDSDVFRKALRSTLCKHFPIMRIDEAATGSEALHQGQEHSLVFMDIRLPDTNGLQLTRQLKAANPRVLVCVITQFDIPEYREAARQSGANGYFLKDNLTETVLVDLVESVQV